MATSPAASNFYTFVTAHAPFELTAIVFSGAAGLRLGYGLIDTKGQTRLASLRREATNALPTVGVAVVLFQSWRPSSKGSSPPPRCPTPSRRGSPWAVLACLVAYLVLGGGDAWLRSRIEEANGPANRPSASGTPARLPSRSRPTGPWSRPRPVVSRGARLALVVVRHWPLRSALAALVAGSHRSLALNVWLLGDRSPDGGARLISSCCHTGVPWAAPP
jgi:hypothetical protein